MKLTYNWLKDFVDIRISPEKLAQKLTMAGLEITSLEKSRDDYVLELEITSNRPDWLSIIGIAREVAALTNKKIKVKNLTSTIKGAKRRASDSSRLVIKVEDKKDCPLYTARIIKGVKVAPSPKCLRQRIESLGMRSVNNIVDITNYVMMETGQPLHAFDLSKLAKDTVFVRRAKDKEKIVTIDGGELNLSKEVLVIADNNKPIAIAGIMGGQYSEVGQGACDILLESAVFDPIITRRACRILGLSSESSYRFERSVDVQNVEDASLRATKLILEIAGGELVLSQATTRPMAKPKAILLKREEVQKVLGVSYAVSGIKNILTALGFSVTSAAGGALKVKPPSFRCDVNQPVDLIEEIARITGYENIPTELAKIIPQTEISADWNTKRVVKDILVSQGMNEVITYNLLGRDLTAKFGYRDEQLISVANPLTVQQEVLRPGLIPGLLSRIAYNLNQKQDEIKIFEIGNIFLSNQEKPCLGLACLGKEINLLHLKGVIETLLGRLGLADFEFTKLETEHDYLQKEISLSLLVNKKVWARLGLVKEQTLKQMDIEGLVFAAELDLNMLFTQIKSVRRKYCPLPLYPEVTRDVSVTVKENTSVGDIIKRINTGKFNYLIDCTLKDIYRGKQISSVDKGLTLSCLYRSIDHTLTSEEVDSSHQQVLAVLSSEFSAKPR